MFWSSQSKKIKQHFYIFYKMIRIIMHFNFYGLCWSTQPLKHNKSKFKGDTALLLSVFTNLQ